MLFHISSTDITMLPALLELQCLIHLISGMSLQTFQCNTEETVTDLGSKLFTRLVSGTRYMYIIYHLHKALGTFRLFLNTVTLETETFQL